MDRDEAISRYAPMIYRLAYARTGNQTDAEDLMQEVFLRFLRANPVLRDAEHGKAWFLRVASNCANDFFRSPWRKAQPLDETMPAPAAPEPGGVLELVLALPPKCRVCVHLFYCEDMSVAEIAAATGVRAGTVKTRPPAHGVCCATRWKEAIAMLNSEYKQEMESFVPNAAQLARLRERLDCAPGHPRLHLERKAVAVIAICAALLVSALAVAPTLWDIIMGDLGAKAPYATEVLASCEDQGIKVEAVAAYVDTNMIRVYLNLTDLTDDRLSDVFDDDLCGFPRDESGNPVTTPDTLYHTGGTESNGFGEGTRVLSYHAETKTATLCASFYGRKDNTTPLHLSMRKLTPGYRSVHFRLDLDSLPMDIIGTTQTSDGHTVLLPNQNPMALSDDDSVSISSIGFDAEGYFHIRIKAKEGISTDMFSGYQSHITFAMIPQASLAESTPVPDGVDYRFSDIRMDDLPQMKYLTILLDGSYSVLGGDIDGMWDMDVALTPIDTISTKGSWEVPPGIVVNQISVSPLSVTVNYRTTQNFVDPLSETSPTITMADGTKQTPAILDQGAVGQNSYNIWEFSAPIDLSAVVSITLEGHTIPLQQ